MTPYPASYQDGVSFGFHPVSSGLSAAGIRFLGLPTPTGGFPFLAVGFLDLRGTVLSRPHWGYHVPHVGDMTGEGALSTPGVMVPWKFLTRWSFLYPNIPVAAHYGHHA